LEEWIGKNANGSYKAPASLISPWHRATTSNLINLFNFENPDFSIPTLPTIAKPAQNSKGVWDPTEMCEKLSDPKSTPPYGHQVFPVVEKGSLQVRGALTEGRNLVFRPTKDTSLQAVGGSEGALILAVQASGSKSNAEVFSVQQSGEKFTIKHTGSDKCLSASGSAVFLDACASAEWNVVYNPKGATYQITHAATGKHLTAGSAKAQLSMTATSFKIYSVNY
jgi:phospholipase C